MKKFDVTEIETLEKRLENHDEQGRTHRKIDDEPVEAFTLPEALDLLRRFIAEFRDEYL